MKKIRILVFSLIFVVPLGQLKSQNSQNKSIDNLAVNSKNWFEGFKKNIGANEFSYGSFRSDIGKSLLTRCTDGQMAIEWQTQVVPASFDQQEAGFLWIAALDLTPQALVFDVFVNGKKRFEITSSNQKEWQLKTSEGGLLSYVTVLTDGNGDAHGYMSLVAPKNWLVLGGSQTIKILGRANTDNTWIIVYQADDALSYLHESGRYNVWLRMDVQQSKNGLDCNIIGAVSLAGSELNYTIDGKTKSVKLTQSNITGNFTLPVSALKKPFKLADTTGELLVVQSLSEDLKATRLQNKSVLFMESHKDDRKFTINATRTYEPKAVSGMFNLANSNLGKGQIYLMNSSHQDIAWMDAPEKCVIERDTMLLTPLFEKGSKDKNYRFDVEDALMLREYTERHPDKKDLVKEMLTDGRISCGSTYIQPYEEMYSGESLARQFYLGAKWLKDEFGYNATIYWNEDVPGRTLQMSQLMAKAGTKYLMISRHERGFFNWYSPDGSFVTTYSPGHYGDAFGPLQKSFMETAQYLATSSLYW